MLLISHPHAVVTTKRPTWLYKSVGPAMLEVTHELVQDVVYACLSYTGHCDGVFDALKAAPTRSCDAQEVDVT